MKIKNTYINETCMQLYIGGELVPRHIDEGPYPITKKDLISAHIYKKEEIRVHTPPGKWGRKQEIIAL